MRLCKIYIPTLGRVNRQITYEGMPDWVKDMTYFVIQPHERKAFEERYPNANIVLLDENVKGIAKTREWIINHGGDDCYAMMDDDLVIWKRNIDRVTRKKTSENSNDILSAEDWVEFIETVNVWFDEGVGLGGCYQKGQIPKDTDHKQHGKFTQCFFINGGLIHREELDWSLKWAEDLHLVLQCLRFGVLTRISDKYLLRADSWWSEGGCKEEGRTVEKDIQSLRDLQTYWGEDLIKIVENRYAPSERYGEQTIGLRIRWSKVQNKYINKTSKIF
jgi:hypothetical protein